ncbi:MAG: hypothetical protein EA377_12125 [Phycisphaerales bacterium]|nr:MAG: hypothetical protein EA377_12125 [Phycisphaerales bacterium]
MAGALVTSAMADTPVLSGSYGWEDGVGTIFGSAGSIFDSANVAAEAGITPNSGVRMLRVTESPHTSGGQDVFIAYIENLEDGDVIRASFFGYDDVPGGGSSGYPSFRIWGLYAQSGVEGEILSSDLAGSAGGNNTFSSGIGWEELDHEWVFDSQGGTRDALVVTARVYSTPVTCEECSTDFYFDDVMVEVFCAANPDLTITFPDGTVIGDPAEPGPECEVKKGPDPCDIDQVDASFGWEDGVSTVGGFGGTGDSLLVADNVDSSTGEVFSGDRSLRIERTDGGGTSIAFVGRIENLQDGDVVTVSSQIFDQYPNTPGSGNRARVWTQYAISGADFDSTTQGATGGTGFTTGIGWEESSYSFVFDSADGLRDAVAVQIRFNGQPTDEVDGVPIEFPAEFFIDDLVLEVCSASGSNPTFIFPDEVDPPQDSCDEVDDLLANLGAPTVSGMYGWEDGKGDILGFFSPFGDCFETPFAGDNITGENIGTDDGLVNSGDRALRITEDPHCGSVPRVYVAYIEGLEDGDVIHGRFFGYDDTPGESPSVRIWGKYAQSGDVDSFAGSAGGNPDFSSGVGWEELCHTWVFDAGDPIRDALAIEVRVYSTPTFCEEFDCSTDYFIDDVEVLVWSSNPGVTITFPDGSVIGEPVDDCPADFDNSGEVEFNDLFTLLGDWGTDVEQTDLNGDGLVDGADLGTLLGSWGPCDGIEKPISEALDLVVTSESIGGGEVQYDVFVQLDASTDELLNVYDGNFTFPASFNLGNATRTIGALPPSFNVTDDPNFQDIFDGGFDGVNVGWYNFDPDDPIGLAGSFDNNQVRIARFIANEGDVIEGDLSATYVRANGQIVQGIGSFTTDIEDPCVGDLTNDGVVNVFDLLELLGDWGPCPGCPADLTGDGVVNVFDLLELLGNWGPCP